MEPSIALHEVTLTYPRNARDAANPAVDDPGAVPAVQHVSFRIRAGERVGIIGRNGAGKSSVLSLIAGLIQPTSGNIAVTGHVTAVMTLGIGLREDFSGRQNIYLDGELQGKSRQDIERTMDDIIAFADIGQFIDYPLRTYSTGMKARLAFAMITNLDPQILIVDEALAVGDIDFVAKSARKIREICERGRIVIMVSHSMQSIVEMCSRCLWLDRGQLVMDGDPATVTAAYLDRVHSEDDASLLERFRRQIGHISYRPGCEILGLNLFNTERGTSIAAILANEPLVIQASIRISAEIEHGDVLIRIVRLDGLTVTENRLSEQYDLRKQGLQGACLVEVRSGPCILAAGVYELILELLDGDEVLARRVTMFDVTLPAPPIGGRPALNYPWALKAMPQAAD